MQDVPYGYCGCGCGERTPISDRNRPDQYAIKGQPRRYVRGHNARRTAEAYHVDEATGCWIWQRTVNAWGYGKVRWKARIIGAHRAAWEAVNGTVPDGHDVHHRCHNKLCVNPAHLESVPQGIHRRHHKGRLTAEQVREIRGTPPIVRGTDAAFARRFGVSPATIADARHRRTYKEIQ